jgi:hypothetical protein
MRTTIRVSLVALLITLLAVISVSAQPTTQGSLGAADAVVSAAVGVDPSTVIQVTGTWSGTITFEASIAGEWTAVPLVRQSTYGLAATTTSNDAFFLANVGYTQLRARMSAYTSGQARIAIKGGSAVVPPGSVAGAPANMWTTIAREDFSSPRLVLATTAAGAKTLAATGTNYVWGSPVGLITYREELVKSASSWIVADNKLDITADNTIISEGVEIYIGDGIVTDATSWITTGKHGGCFTVNYTIGLIAGTAQFVIGWRKHEAFQAGNVYTGYADWSVVGQNNADGSIFSLGEVAGGGTLSDDSGVNTANAGTYTLKSCISVTRVPTAFLNGNPITMTNSGVAKTADIGMNPFISYLAAGTTDANIRINWWEITRQ